MYCTIELPLKLAPKVAKNLKTVGKPLSSTEIGGYFKGAKKDRVSELLELLGGLGQVRALEGDRFSA